MLYISVRVILMGLLNLKYNLIESDYFEWDVRLHIPFLFLRKYFRCKCNFTMLKLYAVGYASDKEY